MVDEQVLGPGEPAVRLRVVPQAVCVLARQEERHVGRGLVQILSAERDVRAVPRLDGTRDVGHPPTGLGQAVQRHRRLAGRQLGLERVASRFPFGGAQRVPPSR